MINNIKEKYSVIKNIFEYSEGVYVRGNLLRNNDLKNCYVDNDNVRIWLKKPTTFNANVLGFIKLNFTYTINYGTKDLFNNISPILNIVELLKLPTTYILKHKGKPVLLSNNKDYKNIHKINVTGNDEWIDVTLHDSINNNEPLNLIELIGRFNNEIDHRNILLQEKFINTLLVNNVTPNTYHFTLIDIYIDVEWECRS